MSGASDNDEGPLVPPDHHAPTDQLLGKIMLWWKIRAWCAIRLAGERLGQVCMLMFLFLV
jgi:hypothetical protein